MSIGTRRFGWVSDFPWTRGRRYPMKPKPQRLDNWAKPASAVTPRSPTVKRAR
jgi:hypothetical protein